VRSGLTAPALVLPRAVTVELGWARHLADLGLALQPVTADPRCRCLASIADLGACDQDALLGRSRRARRGSVIDRIACTPRGHRAASPADLRGHGNRPPRIGTAGRRVASFYGVSVDAVNSSVFEYVPVRSGSVAAIGCLKPT
jgi:hypothetical protein